LTKDLSPFTEDNARWRERKKRVPWDERIKLIGEQFPTVRDADWDAILRDPDVLARVLKDILKVDQIEAGRAGPRPNLDVERGMRTWREMTVGDYSECPFPRAFSILVRNNSVRTVARKTSISKSRVVRLLKGQDHPTIEDLRGIAAAYQKKPAYFVEYRAEYIMAAIANRLADEHEMTVALYKKLVRSP
jgi:transcriptional regulator with XRE-family HTH domain